MWEPLNDLSQEEKDEILNYMESLEGQRFYDNSEELENVLRYVMRNFMSIGMNPIYKYSLGMFNAYLDENLTEDECWYRFIYRRDDNKFLDNGKRNANFGRYYWRVS